MVTSLGALSLLKFFTIYYSRSNLKRTIFTKASKMGYPDSFEGFMIESQKDWTNFKKKDVCATTTNPFGYICL